MHERITRLGCILLLSGGVVPGALRAENSIEYTAEHVLEASMDSRLLSFPLIPAAADEATAQLQLGYGSVGAGRLRSRYPLLGASYFTPLRGPWGVQLSGFHDRYRFSGDSGHTTGELLTVNTPQLPEKFAVDLTGVSGSGVYQGAALALTMTPDNWPAWQVGLARSSLSADNFRAEFSTLDLADNVSGYFNYASRYSINSVFLSMELHPRTLGGRFTYQPHLIIVRNSPRVGFQGGVSIAGTDYLGDTRSNGNGAHIPDNYVGFGVMLREPTSGIAVDLGASLYNFIGEPYGHGGVKSPLMMTVTLPFKL